ncbi:MAG TPA: hypothetical protein VN943_09320 [Candidatus Acidoferrum sp.]|nr:hypothetical protein [Candidatus Acidoferrum sp.]
MKRRWNILLYAGFVLTLLAGFSYPLFFIRFPVTRDIPWVNWLLFGVALAVLSVGLWRAYRKPDLYRGKISGPILATLSVGIVAFFAYGVIWHSKEIPAAKAAPQVGQKAPDFTLPDTQGRAVTLSSLWGTSVAAPATGHADQWVLLIFYRGYW